MKRHRNKKPTDAEIAKRWSYLRNEERQRYERTVGWLKCCASARIVALPFDVYVMPCPSGRPHQIAVLDDRKGHIRPHCDHCPLPVWRLNFYLDNLLETTA